jgi:DNA invertase Pin-like site-specific DNA recombinase
MKTRAFNYLRFSDKKQKKGDSKRRQKDWPTVICEMKGWILDDSLNLNDEGLSAFRGKNREFGALAVFLEAVKLGKVLPGDVLIVESLDRLSRENIDDHFMLFRSILKAGVLIQTREPERLYTAETLKSIAGIMEPLVYMERANNESRTKSMRLRSFWKERRQQMRKGEALNHYVVPAWIAKTKNGRFILKTEAAKAIRKIFQLAGEGWGLVSITHKLNGDKTPVIGRSGKWARSYVAKILSDRSVLGEYQPHAYHWAIRNKTGDWIIVKEDDKNEEKEWRRVPDGEPVKNYFPAVISEEQWYDVRRAVKGRGEKGRGRRGATITNLFTGLIRDARDGHVMHLQYAGSCHANNARILVSAGARDGLRGCSRMPFPYDIVESSFLSLVRELKADEVLGQKGDDKAAQIALLSAKLEETNDKLKKVQAHGESSSVASDLA